MMADAVSMQGKLKPIEVPGNATASLQWAPSPNIAEEAVEELVNSSFDGLDGIDCESAAHGDLDANNVTIHYFRPLHDEDSMPVVD